MTLLSKRLALLALCLALAASPARGLVVVSGNGSGNTTAPADDPGFAWVGSRVGALGVVYLGNGWVLTANHVGPGDVILNGVTYSWIPYSWQQLTNPDSSPTDLLVFRLRKEPPLSWMPIRGSTPPVGSAVTMMGRGRRRTTTTTNWRGHNGWVLGTSGIMQWGTNVVHQTGLDLALSGTTTRGISTSFSETGGTTHEAQGVGGDSGGALFVKNGATWELVGLMHAIDTYNGQSPDVVLFGNLTLASDLSYYKAQIDAIVATPACADGLDNDGDGLVDAPADPGCQNAGLLSREDPECNDGIDNDGDGKTDFPADIGCGAPYGITENPQPTCGLGFELALLLPPLAWARRRRTRR